MANLFQPSLMRATDSNGNPLPGAKMSFYLSGTSALATVYTTAAGNVAHADPVVADSAGIFPAIYLSESGVYRVKLTGSSGSPTIWDVDPVAGVDAGMVAGAAATATAGATAAAASAVAAASSATSASSSASSAAASATTASGYAAAAAIAAGNIFSAAADGVSNGVVSTSSLVAGSGGTNGTFAVSFTGGGGSGAAATFTVAGGALTSITVTAKGVGYTSAPTMSFAASAGLSGASATAVIGPRTATGEYFLVSSGGNIELYKNVAGVATDQNVAIASTTAVNNEDTRALLASVPRGAIGIWPFDRFASSSIPNIIGTGANLTVLSGGSTAGVFAGHGTITFSSSQTLDDWTTSCLVQVTAINTYNTILYDFTGDVDHYTNFSIHSVSTMGFTPGAPINPRNFDLFRLGIEPNAQNQFGGFTNLVGKGWHVLTTRQDRTGLTYWLDGIKLYQDIGNTSLGMVFTKLRFGRAPDLSTAAHNYAGFLGIWDRGLSDEEVREVVWQQRACVAPNAILPNERANRVLIAEGDSNHGPHDNNCWIWQFYPNDSPENFGGSYAINGSTVAGLNARASMVDGVIPPQIYGRKFILTVGIGTNDLTNYNSTTVTSTFIPLLRAYMIARKAAGWTLALFTVPKRGDLAGAAATNFETLRATLNADILANPTLYGLTGVGQVIDIGSAAGIGSSFDSAKYAADLLHFSATGGAQVEVLARAVINAL